jgi:thymidylate kinase
VQENFEIQSVVIEGGDQVGKGDAQSNLSLELSEMGYEVINISFPCYSTPTGFAIRSVLKEGFPEYLEMDSEEELSVKMGLFALNRLEVVNNILYMERSPNSVFLFDRGPYSHSLTIAYDLFSKKKDITEETLQPLIEMALDMDSFTIKSLNMDKCIIKLFLQGGQWKVQREKEDLHDQEGVQGISERVYESFGEILGDNWCNIPTKVNGDWRLREDILKDNINFIKSKFNLDGVGIRKGSLREFGINDIISSLYGFNLTPNLAQDFDTALKANCKKDMYLCGEFVARDVVSKANNFNWANEEISFAVRNILKYSDNFGVVLNHIYDNDFGTKFVNSV